MIQCDVCDEWFHGRCVGITPGEALMIDKYFCPFCKQKKNRQSKQFRFCFYLCRMDPIIDLFPESPLSRELEGELEGEVSTGELDFIKIETENVDELSNQTKQAPITVPSVTRKRAQVRKPAPKGFRSTESAKTAAPQKELAPGKGRGGGHPALRQEPVVGAGSKQSSSPRPAAGRGAGISALLAGSGHSPFRSADSSSVQPDLTARTGTKRPSSTPQPRRKKHRSACPIGGCGHASPKLRWHIYHHLPNFLCPQEEHTSPKWSSTLTKRTRGLRLITHFLLGTEKLDSLVTFTNDKWQSVDSPLSENDRTEVGLLLEKEGWERVVPTFQPINTPAILTHWRPLAFLWDSLSSQQKEAVGQIDNEPCPPAPAHSGPVPEVEMAEPGPPTPAMPFEPSSTGLVPPPSSTLEPSLTGPANDPIDQVAGFDAHFHPDRLQSAASGHARKQDGRHAMVPGCEPDHLFPITGGILNYCDPEFFSRPTIEEEVLGKKRGPNWKVAVGIHPKRAANYTPAQWDCFLKLLSNPRVSAISEIGFDFTVSNSLWLYQEELFDKILSLGTLGRVLIMHLRGLADDRCSQVANRLALRRLRKACLVHQRIHLHTFSGDAGMVHAWLKAFPHCYFGVSGLVRSFNPDQLQAVREIPLNRLLLETDAPHLKLHPECSYNTPFYLGDVGQHVAKARGMSLPDLMRATSYTNAQRLYC